MEFTLSSRTNPSHSTFIARWDQVSVITNGPAVRAKKIKINKWLCPEPWVQAIGQSKQTKEADTNRFCKSVGECVDQLIISFTLFK